jgi:hypothetical protein
MECAKRWSPKLHMKTISNMLGSIVPKLVAGENWQQPENGRNRE